jgi:hypothetical protein
MIHEACILFAYHKVDALTLHHLALLKQHNLHVPIVPLTDDVPDHLDGGVDVKSFPDPWPKTRPWRRCDTMLYRWFLNRNVQAERYLWLEYDVRCTVRIREAYAEVWDADVACRDLMLCGRFRNTRQGRYLDVEWNWFSEIGLMHETDRPFAAGLVPLACTLFSHRGLEAITSSVTNRDIYCELRIGTAARKSGLNVVEFPEALRSGIRWDPHATVPTGDGIFHAVKKIRDPVAMPNLARGRPASQSSVSDWSRARIPSLDAAGGNNGNIDGNYGFHTAKEKNPWWQVDLEAIYQIDRINLYNRHDCADRLRHFKVLTSIDGMDWECAHHKTSDAVWGESIEPYEISIPDVRPARFVRIVLDGTEFLHFCECEIFGTHVSQ